MFNKMFSDFYRFNYVLNFLIIKKKFNTSYLKKTDFMGQIYYVNYEITNKNSRFLK